MAAISILPSISVPGLHSIPTLNNLRESSNMYNQLPADCDQPLIPQQHLQQLAPIFVRFNVHNKFGLHLLHSHLKIKEDAVMLGTEFASPSGCWSRPTHIREVDCENVHGHIFMLCTDGRMVAYEYREGPLSDFSGVDPLFFQELANYLRDNKLTGVLGLQVFHDWPPKEMIEMELKDSGTVMLDAFEAKHGDPYRVTGWCIEQREGIISFKGNETHSPTTRGGHQPFRDGKPIPDLATLKSLLKKEGII